MEKILLIDRANKKDQRDITELFDCCYTSGQNPNDIWVVYHHTLVNGQKIANKCTRLHKNSYIKIVNS